VKLPGSSGRDALSDHRRGRRLTDAMDPRYRTVVLLAAYGGLRAGELFGLAAKRVDVLHRRITIAETVVDVGGHLHFGPPKTRAGHRIVPLPKWLQTRSVRISLPMPGAQRISFSRRPRAARFAQLVASPLLGAGAQGGQPRPSPAHDLRHTAVALWIAAGAHRRKVAVRAGHSSVSFTLDRYGHLFPGSESVLNDSLDALARDGRETAEETRRARSRAIEADSFAHVARTPDETKKRSTTRRAVNRTYLVGAAGLEPRPQPCEGCALTS